MNFSSVQLGLAFNLLVRTLPILLIRLGAMLLFWLAALIYLAIVGGVAFLIGQAIEIVGWIIFIVAVGSLIPIYNLAYRYVFYMIKAAHIAVMSELLVNGTIPDGRGQLDWGRSKVQERFTEMNAMFVIDEMVSGVVHAFTWTVYNLMSWLPGDTLQTLAGILKRVINYALNYIDEAILARSFWHQEQNVWENARDGVVLYAMSWKTMLSTAITLMVISFIPGIVAFVIFAAPIGFILGAINPALAGWSLIFILLFAWLVKVALGDTFAIAAILATYQRETQNKVPDPQMSARLDQVSEQFGDLKRRAQETFSGQKPATTPAPHDSTSDSAAFS